MRRNKHRQPLLAKPVKVFCPDNGSLVTTQTDSLLHPFPLMVLIHTPLLCASPQYGKHYWICEALEGSPFAFCGMYFLLMLPLQKEIPGSLYIPPGL